MQRARYLRNRYGQDSWQSGGGGSLARRLIAPNAAEMQLMEGDSATLLIAFGGMRGGFGMPLFEFSSLTAGVPVKRLFVRDLRQAWYHQGIPHRGRTLLAVAEWLRELIAAHRVRRLVTTGNSAGGYAAIAFGALLGAESVLAFAPQTVIELAALSEMGDHRWDERVEPLERGRRLDRAWTDLRSALPRELCGDTRCDVYFDDSHPTDRLHAERLDGLAGVQLHAVGSSRHYVAREMRDSGLLHDVLERALGVG